MFRRQNIFVILDDGASGGHEVWSRYSYYEEQDRSTRCDVLAIRGAMTFLGIARTSPEWHLDWKIYPRDTVDFKIARSCSRFPYHLSLLLPPLSKQNCPCHTAPGSVQYVHTSVFVTIDVRVGSPANHEIVVAISPDYAGRVTIFQEGALLNEARFLGLHVVCGKRGGDWLVRRLKETRRCVLRAAAGR